MSPPPPWRPLGQALARLSQGAASPGPRLDILGGHAAPVPPAHSLCPPLASATCPSPAQADPASFKRSRQDYWESPGEPPAPKITSRQFQDIWEGGAQAPGAVSGTKPWAERGLGLGHGWGTGTGRDMETGRWPGKPRGGWGPAEAHGNAVQTGAEAETGALAPRTGRPQPLQRGASPGHRRPGQPPEGSGQLGS